MASLFSLKGLVIPSKMSLLNFAVISKSPNLISAKIPIIFPVISCAVWELITSEKTSAKSAANPPAKSKISVPISNKDTK